jgi:hypothetical protein
LRKVPAWVWWSLAGLAFLVLIALTVLVFPVLLRPGLSANERAQLQQQGADKLVAADSDRSNAQNNVRTTLLQGIAGAALLTGAYFAYKQLEAAREGQITTRYTEAVKQLGDEEHLDIRIGGIYALKRIAEDSQDRDAPTIVDLLSAFVRKSHRTESKNPEGVELPGMFGGRKTLLHMRAPDVQIALTVMGDLHHSQRIAIFGAYLPGADLTEADLVGADLYRTDLTDAYLFSADLSHAQLTEAVLHGAYLSGANLASAHLIDADLTGADLADADLSGADLTDAYLTGADLSNAAVDGVQLAFARGTPRSMPDGSPGVPLGDVDASDQ